MSTMIPLDPHSEYKRAYDVEMLQQQMYGAVMACYMFRRDNDQLTNVEMARRAGWTRSQVSKLLAAPQNWTLKTIAELCNTLDVNLHFILEDKFDKSRGFNAFGFVSHPQTVNSQVSSQSRIGGRATLQPIDSSFNSLNANQIIAASEDQPLQALVRMSQQTVD